MDQLALAQVVRREHANDQAYAALRRAILQGRLAPGERLVENRLAELLNVSRTPVREALRKLEVEGLARPLESGGLVVGDTPTVLAEIYGMRQRIEGYIARLAAERISDGELAKLDAVCAQMSRSVRNGTSAQRDRLTEDFHSLLAEASHSPRLIRLAAEYRGYGLTDPHLPPTDQLQRLADPRINELLLAQHGGIVDALRAHDPDQAERAASDHLANVLRLVEQTRDDARVTRRPARAARGS